ncbi:MAG: ABC transporter substrate-binding protein [Bacillota bacterium]|jgi:NitT/TauT family transport system substrate-binding protein
MKKIFSIMLIVFLCLGLLAACGNEATEKNDNTADKATIKIASLKGPTTMGMVKLMSDNEAGQALNNYEFQIMGTADEIVTKIVSGEIDAAAVPCNLASVLYNKTNGGIKISAINTLGVLYIVENSDKINSIEDLKGMTIYTTGKGTTPEYILNYILSANGIDPKKDVTIEFKSESTELATLLSQDQDIVAMLPEPYVTTAKSKNDKLRVALNMTEEWDKTVGQGGSSMVTGVLIVRNDFLQENEEAWKNFLSEYKASTQYVNNNVADAAALVGKYEIAPQPVAEKVIPNCNITYIDGTDMQTKVSGYLQVLFEQDPKSIGGKLPDAQFYYIQ